MNFPPIARAAFPAVPADLDKRSAGVVTVVGGSPRYNQAPVLTGLGARVGGAGLVQLVVPDASRISAGALIPEATFMKLTPACVPPKADVTVVGPGLGVTPTSDMLISRLLSGSKGRFVLDADALNTLAHWYAKSPAGYTPAPGQQLVLTPHVGEAARLLACKPEEVSADRLGAAAHLVARYRAVVALKGPGTIVTAPGVKDPYICPAGNPFMALGGMGDLLAGIIAARWARLGDAFTATAGAVWIHAAASDRLIAAEPPADPSVAETARSVSVLRVMLERKHA